MEPTSFNEANVILGPPIGMTIDECQALSVLITTQKETDSPVVISCWKITRDELEEIVRTGRVWVTIYGRTMPPIIVDGKKPI